MAAAALGQASAAALGQGSMTPDDSNAAAATTADATTIQETEVVDTKEKKDDGPEPPKVPEQWQQKLEESEALDGRGRAAAAVEAAAAFLKSRLGLGSQAEEGDRKETTSQE